MIVYTLGPDEVAPIEADLIEFRPDFTEKRAVTQKVLLTNQSPEEGASYCDVAYPKSFKDQKTSFPCIKWVYSYHGPYHSYQATSNLLEEMDKERPDLMKICFDRISFSEYLQLKPLFAIYQDRLILFAQGEECQATRLLSYLWGAEWIYTSKNGFFGQIPFRELLEIYQIRRCTKKTALYGLIKGKESPPSVGAKLYNPLFAREQIDALYMNIVLEETELKSVLCSDLFQGFSITMPFKEKAFLFCLTHAPCAQLCRSINTFANGVGYNTDIEILKTLPLQKKKIGILGGGGVAKAYANFLKKSCDVELFVRCKHKKEEIQKEMHVKVSLIDAWHPNFEVLIDTLPVRGLALEIKKGTLVLDTKLYHDPQYETHLNFINGKEVFLAQGRQQLKIFFKKEFVL